MSASSPSESAEPTHVVVQNLNDASDLVVVEIGRPVAMIYTQVFGPASRAACEAWVAARA